MTPQMAYLYHASRKLASIHHALLVSPSKLNKPRETVQEKQQRCLAVVTQWAAELRNGNMTASARLQGINAACTLALRFATRQFPILLPNSTGDRDAIRKWHSRSPAAFGSCNSSVYRLSESLSPVGSCDKRYFRMSLLFGKKR